MGVATGWGAFSGGLDSVIAARLLIEQGIRIELVTLASPFFGMEDARAYAAQLEVPWHRLDFTETMLSIVADPATGYGSRMNPCVDCHAGMLRFVYETFSPGPEDFLFTGEVLGQRPFSQNRGSMRRIEKLSGLPGRVLRPLSAKLLDPTEPEVSGVVDRERLLDLSGRGRKRQMALARSYGLDYRQPGGGCLLTDPAYAERLRVVLEMDLLSAETAELLKHGRMFRTSPGSVGLVGRSREDNERLEELSKGRLTLRLGDRPGPLGVHLGESLERAVDRLAGLVALYGKVASGEKVRVLLSDGRVFDSRPSTREEATARHVIPPPPTG
ncbi:tRNA 4-thiouridine(8) synthase ThiI [Candidatus Fermentibacteria bacterium]|nr:tRNA 4-thiouridine(8) synthase ThiI [Candidatus Fermentibacteria bacterium]